MSYTYGTLTESLYSYGAASTNLSGFTTEDNLQKTYPPVQLILPVLMADARATGRRLIVDMAGQLGTTGAPTFQWSVRLLTSTTWSAGGILLGTSAALTAGTTQTLAPWFGRAVITLRTPSIAAASTVVTTGLISSPLGLASPFAGTIPANNVSPAVATVDNSLTYYLFVSCACGTNNALNLINLQQLAVNAE